MPAGFADDRSKPLLAAHFEYTLELGIHRVALGVRQGQPSLEQLVRLALLHGGEVDSVEKPLAFKVAFKQGFGHLAEKGFG